MYKEIKKCQLATINQLLKRKGRLIEEFSDMKSFVMGTISENELKCGKKNCACHDKKNPKLHGPYKNLSYRGGDKNGTIFLTEEKVPIAEKMIDQYANLKNILKEISCINLELLRRNELQNLF